MGKLVLDPNAVVYTDDEIVGKVNAAAVPITRVDAIEDAALKESTDFQKLSQVKEDKLDGIDEGAKNMAIISDWVATQAYAVDDEVKPSAPNDFKYVCTTAGDSGATEPVWGTVEGGVTVDGTAEWTARKWSAGNADDIPDGVTKKMFTADEDTKLGAIEAGAEVNQGDDEIIGQINSGTVPITREAALDNVSLKVIKSEPISGENRINFIVKNVAGNLEADFDDTPES